MFKATLFTWSGQSMMHD